MGLKNLLTDPQNFKFYPFNGGIGPTLGYSGDGTTSAFKSLKFGSDRPGNGNSGQPYVTVSSKNSFDLQFSDLGTKAGTTDFLLRGGTLLPERIIQDEERIGKFLKSTQGLLFITKQNALSKINPVFLPSDIYPQNVYNPVSTLIQIAGNAEGLHVNKQGLNPFAFTGNGQDNSYFTKTTPIFGADNYSTADKNRLSLLYGTKILKTGTTRINNDNGRTEYIYNENSLKGFNISSNPLDVIGKRNRVTDTTKEESYFLGERREKFSTYPSKLFIYSRSGNQFTIATGDNTDITKPFQQDSAYFDSFGSGDGIKDFRNYVPQSERFNSFLAKSKYQTNNLVTTFGSSDPGLSFGKNVTNITASTAYEFNPQYGVDKINKQLIYSGSTVTQDLSDSDLVPFYFQVVNNDDPSLYQFIHFRAYLNNFADTFNSTWNSHKYSGRGENFYIYDSFTRGINLGFTVAIESRAEQKAQYQKINYLASLMAPDYSRTTGFMRGNFIKLTIGDYLTAVPGFLTNLTYTINEGVSWDIAKDQDGKNMNKTDAEILPMVIDVSLSFTPVHNFVPQKGKPFISNPVSI
jgi:hypothetical protein